MKYSFLLFFCLISLSTQAQEFKKGYLLFTDSTTQSPKMRVTRSSLIEYTYDSKVYRKVSKSKLLDFGYIVDGKKQSLYASHGFVEKTQKAFYFLQGSQDTIPFYFISYSDNSIVGYSQNRKKTTLQPNKVQTLVAQNGSKTSIFDGINIGQYTRKGLPKYKFFERKVDGEIYVYTLNMKKKELEEIEQDEMSLMRYLLEDPTRPSIGQTYYRVKTNYYFVFIVNKAGRLTFIPYNSTHEMHLMRLRQLVMENPDLQFKIGTEGYTIMDTPAIIEEYNDFKRKLTGQN